jgi:hypothetical protein
MVKSIACQCDASRTMWPILRDAAAPLLRMRRCVLRAHYSNSHAPSARVLLRRRVCLSSLGPGTSRGSGAPQDAPFVNSAPRAASASCPLVAQAACVGGFLAKDADNAHARRRSTAATFGSSGPVPIRPDRGCSPPQAFACVVWLPLPRGGPP